MGEKKSESEEMEEQFVKSLSCVYCNTKGRIQETGNRPYESKCGECGQEKSEKRYYCGVCSLDYLYNPNTEVLRAHFDKLPKQTGV